MQMVERMEKLFLRTFLTYNKLNIVDQQYVVISILFAEGRHGKLVPVFTYLKSVDQFIRECLAGDV